MANIMRPLNTTFNLPPIDTVVSPVSLNSPGAGGTHTPISAAEQKFTFWSSSPTTTPAVEKKPIFVSHNATPPVDDLPEPRSPGSAHPVYFGRKRSIVGGMRPGVGDIIRNLTTLPGDTSATPATASSATAAAGVGAASSGASHHHHHHRKSSFLATKRGNKNHNVSFSDSSWESDRSKAVSSQDPESSQSENSRPNSPRIPEQMPKALSRVMSKEDLAMQEARARVIEFVDKRVIALARDISPPPAPKDPPFVAYTDAFLQIVGQKPRLEQILHDRRAPFFGGSGCFHRATSTLFITSALVKDPSPAFAPSRNWNTITTSLTFYADDDVSRDKVRFSDNYMPGGSCIWHPAAASSRSPTSPTTVAERPLASSLIMCSRGSLGTPAGLIQVAPRRPHTVTPLVTHYPGGRAFNSPHSVVALSDGSLLFTDPPVGYEVGYRPRPQLPPLVHRFDPATGDVRAVADGLLRPTCIALSPDEHTVYIVDAPRQRKMPGKGCYFEDVLTACNAPMPTIQAYSIARVAQSPEAGAGGVFLTNKRLFAFPGLPTGQEPTGLAVSLRGDVYVACGDSGVLVYSKDGTLIGRIRFGESKEKAESVSGVCCGRKGELFAWGGSKLWRISV